MSTTVILWTVAMAFAGAVGLALLTGLAVESLVRSRKARPSRLDRPEPIRAYLRTPRARALNL